VVDYDDALAWIESRFDSIQGRGKDLKVNSPFTDDDGHHLWVCPEKNCFNCWKTGTGGTLIDLVMKVDKCDFAEAKAKLGLEGGYNVRALEKKLREQWGGKMPGKGVPAGPPPPEPKLVLPPNTFKIASMAENRWRKQSEEYVLGRKLPVRDLMVCIAGEFKDRIVIPYLGRNRELIYWNSRDLTGRAKLRYRGPLKAEVGVGKEDVLWMSSWPRRGSRIYLTEGEFDAMSLAEAGLFAGACGGKEISEKQLDLLEGYGLCICFDTDESGRQALHKLEDRFQRAGFEDVTFCRPPTRYKDWNEMLNDAGERVIRAYIEANERKFNVWTSTTLRLFSS